MGGVARANLFGVIRSQEVQLSRETRIWRGESKASQPRRQLPKKCKWKMAQEGGRGN